jgi:signal transduction histidine kinase
MLSRRAPAWFTQERIELALVAIGVLFGLLNVLVIVVNPYHYSIAALLTSIPVTIAVGWSFLFVGLVATRRRRGNPIGVLMSLFGVTWFFAGIEWINSPLAWAVGDLLRLSYLGVLGHILLVYPRGRPQSRLEVALIWAVYSTVVIGSVAASITNDWKRNCVNCASNALYVPGTSWMSTGVIDIANGVAVVVAILVVATVIRHWRQSSPPARRALTPALWAILPIFFVVIIYTLVNVNVIPPSLQAVLSPLEEIIFAVLPVGLLVGVLRTRLGRTAVSDLVIELSRPPTSGTLRDSLARALGDPSLQLALALPGGGYVDSSGRSLALPSSGSARTVTAIDSDGKPLAALIHDPAVDEEDPGLVAAVGSAARLALENERLQAEVRASLEEVRASRARILEAADAERRRLERDIHDGAQQRLVALGLAIRLARDQAAIHGDKGLVTDLDGAAAQLQQAMGELRELARGIHPAVLSRAGIGPALRVLAELSPIPVEIAEVPAGRYPEAVEAAVYFVVSEALTNAAKHSGAQRVNVSVRRDNGDLWVDVRDDGAGGAKPSGGSGLVGMADRVAVLGGRIEVSSPTGAGTLVHAEIPCG